MEREDYIDKINSLTSVIEHFKESYSMIKAAVESSEKRNEALQSQVVHLQEIICTLTDEIRSLREEISKQSDYTKRHNKISYGKKSLSSRSKQGEKKSREEEKMGVLYQLEEDQRRLELSAQEIKKRRNDASTNKIVDELRYELFDLLALSKDEKSDLMQWALNYLHSFWKQLFAYRNNGEYTIDNLAAERAIRPLTVQRKNSLFFGSTKGALNSAVYNTFIETCKQVGISFRDYFRTVFKELGSGREDYENLLPMTIGLKWNN